VPALADEVRGAYLEALGNFLQGYAESLGKLNILHTVVDTGKPLDEALLSFLMGRAKRR
jgi:hypothetical protein